MNWWAVVGSAPFLTLGLASGVWLAWNSRSNPNTVDLMQPGYAVSGIVWMAMMALFGWLVSRQQSSGKIVAWRTLWACGFLLVTLICFEVFSSGIHGKKRSTVAPNLSHFWSPEAHT